MMARISDLVKTYRLLSDPNAPDWNVKFIGGIVIAFALIAAAGAMVWNTGQGAQDATTPAAVATGEPGDVTTCEPTEVAEEMARLGTTSLPAGHSLPSGCVVG